MSDLYEEDITLWSERQAELLRYRAAGEPGNDGDLDWLNIAEEIESMGRSERDLLTSRLALLLAYLLKWHHQSGHRGNSWRLTILEQRRRAEKLLGRNPSLRPRLDDLLAEAYADALPIAEQETGLPGDTFPETCPWAFDETLRVDLLTWAP